MMRFDSLLKRLRSRLSPAEYAMQESYDVRQAAVALILRRHADAAEVLMIKRAIRPGDHWSGNLALPGGRWQGEDANLLFTAIRETYEEVGIDLSAGGEVLGQLDSIKTRNPLIPPIDVTPFVFVAPPPFHAPGRDDRTQPLNLNHEVAAAFWVSIDYLKSAGPAEVYEMVIEGSLHSWPAYPSEEGPIWGMTERMLTRFLLLIE